MQGRRTQPRYSQGLSSQGLYSQGLYSQGMTRAEVVRLELPPAGLSRQVSNISMISLASTEAESATTQILQPPLILQQAWAQTDRRVKHALRESGRQALLLLEKVISWLTGCAWTDVFFASNAKPSVFLALKDVAVAASLLLIAVAWLVILGGRMELSAGVDRSEAESYFLCNSASFFVGWAWVVVLRDFAAVSGQLVISAPPDSFDVLGLVGLESRAQQRERSGAAFFGALGGIVIAGPVATVAVIWAKHRFLTAFTKAGQPSTKGLLLDLLVRGADEEEGNEMFTRLGRRTKEGRERVRQDAELAGSSNANHLL